MTWTSRNIGIGLLGATFCQLLTDGRLLMGVTATPSLAKVLTPDSTGSYLNGTFSSTITLPNSYSACSTVITERGDVLIIGSENAAGFETIARFNRTSNTFTQLNPANDGANVDHQGRTGVIPMANGRLMCRRGGQRLTFDPSGAARQRNEGDSGAGTESSYTLVPDGRLFSFPAETGFGTSPNGELYVLDDDGRNGTLLTVPLPTYTPTAFAYPSGRAWWIDTFGVGYEIAGPMWMPKIGRIAIVGGEMGEMFTYDPAANLLEVAGRITPAPHPLYGFATQGVIGSTDVGRTATQIAASGVFEYTVTGTPPHENSTTLFVETTPGRFFRVSGGTRTINGVSNPTGVPVNGDVVRRTGFSVSLDIGTPIASGAIISTGPQATRCAEGWQAILPSGDLVFIGSLCRETQQFGSHGNLYRWPGTGTPTLIDTARPSSPNDLGGSHNSMPQLLPSGELAVFFSGGHLWFYTDPEAPDPTAAPVITRLASRVFPGASFVLEGRQLHGRHVGAHFGDEYTLGCNHPQVRLTRVSDGTVSYANVHSWTYRGIEPDRLSNAIVDLPATMTAGEYDLRCISAGNVSAPVRITCDTRSSQSLVVG